MMWPRVAELIVAGWLVLSPWIPGLATAGPDGFDLAIVAFVAAMSLASFWPRASRLHLANLAAAATLVARGLLGGPAGPDAEGRLVVGLLLVIFALVPSRSSEPPREWARVLRSREEEAPPAGHPADGAPGQSLA